MQELSENYKKKIQSQVDKITTSDESEIKNKIQSEIDSLKEKKNKKLDVLISNAELLAKILKCDDFPIGEISKKWIIFGLNYLVSDVDLIPDAIPGIGYSDDSMILKWVISLIKEDIKRFNYFIEARESDKQLINNIVQGSNEQQYVFFPGFFETKTKDKNHIDWIKLMRNIDSPFDSPGISVFDWEFNYFKEFNKMLPMIDHALKLKPIFDSETFGIEWQQMKVDLINLGKRAQKELLANKNNNPDKEIIAICLNSGSSALFTALEMSDKKLVDKIYLFGATCTERRFLNSISDKGIKIYNLFSENDHTLQFIFDNYEHQQRPIGLGELHSIITTGVVNMDASKLIKKHIDYRYKFVELINTVS